MIETWIDLRSAMYGRRAIRRYTGEPVDRALVEALVHAAAQAPSAMNREPWTFAVFLGRKRVHEIAVRATAHLRGDPRARLWVQSGELEASTYDPFHGAPALIVVCATVPDSQAAEDCNLAAANLMLAAYAARLGTCPVGIVREWLALAQTKSELGIPADLVPVFPVVAGYPDETPQSHGRRPARILWL